MSSKIVKCIDCGEEYPKKELNRKGRCHDCGWKMVGQAGYQLHHKSGPIYDKWKERIKAAAEKL